MFRYTYGFVMGFSTLERLKAYIPHPAHTLASAELLRLCTHILDFNLAHT
ncbi:Dabb family protein [Thermosporothrix hazakensis]